MRIKMGGSGRGRVLPTWQVWGEELSVAGWSAGIKQLQSTREDYRGQDVRRDWSCIGEGKGQHGPHTDRSVCCMKVLSTDSELALAAPSVTWEQSAPCKCVPTNANAPCHALRATGRQAQPCACPPPPPNRSRLAVSLRQPRDADLCGVCGI
jgi:hypothetical protein